MTYQLAFSRIPAIQTFRILGILLLSGLGSVAFAQWTQSSATPPVLYPTNTAANVSLGANTTSPYKLDITSTATHALLKLTSTAADGAPLIKFQGLYNRTSPNGGAEIYQDVNGNLRFNIAGNQHGMILSQGSRLGLFGAQSVGGQSVVDPSRITHTLSVMNNSGEGIKIYGVPGTESSSNLFFYPSAQSGSLDPNTNHSDNRNWVIATYHDERGDFSIRSSNDRNSNPYGSATGTTRLKINRNGLVGIGHSAPAYRLDIQSDDTHALLRLTSTSAAGTPLIKFQGAYNRTHANGGAEIYQDVAGNVKLNINANRHGLFLTETGRLGLFATATNNNPGNITHTLSVMAKSGEGVKIYGEPGTESSSNLFLQPASSHPVQRNWAIVTYHTKDGDFQIRSANSNNANPYEAATSTARVHIDPDGKIGIGHTDPLYDMDFKNGAVVNIRGTGGRLYVNNIAANTQGKVNVESDLNVTGALSVNTVVAKSWSITPDYVFEPDYELRPLEMVEKHVKEKRHLPDVPSAKELDGKGLDLAEMNMTLLRKVEELTLYAIAQDKDARRQREELKAMRRELEDLRGRIGRSPGAR